MVAGVGRAGESNGEDGDNYNCTAIKKGEEKKCYVN